MATLTLCVGRVLADRSEALSGARKHLDADVDPGLETRRNGVCEGPEGFVGRQSGSVVVGNAWELLHPQALGCTPRDVGTTRALVARGRVLAGMQAGQEMSHRVIRDPPTWVHIDPMQREHA